MLISDIKFFTFKSAKIQKKDKTAKYVCKKIEWKRKLAAKYDQIFENRLILPEGMESGYYKYIVFDTPLKQQTGQVFGPGDLGDVIAGVDANVPNSHWITEHHKCAPIYYGYEEADKSVDELRAILL